MDKLKTPAPKTHSSDEWEDSTELTDAQYAQIMKEEAAFMADNPGLGTGMLDY